MIRQVGDDLNFRLRQLHEQLLEQVPDVDRIACALYEPSDDMLKTFVHSTRQGEAIKGYEFHLAESASLSALAASRSVRILDEIADVVNPGRLRSGLEVPSPGGQHHPRPVQRQLS